MNTVLIVICGALGILGAPLLIAQTRNVDWLLDLVKIELGMALKCIFSVLGSPCAIHFAAKAWWKALFWTRHDIEALRKRSADA